MYDVKPVNDRRSTVCGPVSLKMLLSYYNIDADLDTLIEECNIRVDGCTAADLLRVGRAHGLDQMVAFKMEAAELVRQDRPAIIWWRYHHFCVFCGTNDAGDVVICNPSSARYAIDFGTFAALYSGVALFNGEPVTGDAPASTTERLTALEDELAATKIILGVE